MVRFRNRSDVGYGATAMSRLHPLHQLFITQPPNITLSELFQQFDKLDFDTRDEILFRAADLLEQLGGDPFYFGAKTVYQLFKQGCHRLATQMPEHVVSLHVMSHLLWVLALTRTYQPPRQPKPTPTLQLHLFPNEPEPAPGHLRDTSSLYWHFCSSTLPDLLRRSCPVTQRPDYNHTLFLALCELRGVGYWTLRKLIKNGQFEYLSNIDSAKEFTALLRAAGATTLDMDLGDGWRARLEARGTKLLERLERERIRLIFQADHHFPPQLRSIDEPPLWLFVEGETSALLQRAVAIVGTRTPTPEGIQLAHFVGDCLPHLRAAVVSGLADGIDQHMHNASLAHHVPTIAVLGTGILSTYPEGSGYIRDQICAEGGAVITEYLPRDSYSAKNFVRRNRIQAGISQVVIPVEWQVKSGTAHTVRYAFEAKRKIVCPRLGTWHDGQHPELIAARQMGAKVFTLPEKRDDFIREISTFLQ